MTEDEVWNELINRIKRDDYNARRTLLKVGPRRSTLRLSFYMEPSSGDEMVETLGYGKVLTSYYGPISSMPHRPILVFDEVRSRVLDEPQRLFNDLWPLWKGIYHIAQRWGVDLEDHPH